jgi:hypothetical protein
LAGAAIGGGAGALLKGFGIAGGRLAHAADHAFGTTGHSTIARMLGFKACFGAGTPILTREGPKPIEAIEPGDLVLSRPEDDPDAPVEARLVEETFERTGLVLELVVGGKLIRTTGEHPFWVLDRGWVNAQELAEGDLLSIWCVRL